MKIALLGSFLLGAWACGVPASANPALRCDDRGGCPDEKLCHAGFCLDGDPIVANDAGPVTEPDAALPPVVAPPPVAITPLPVDAGTPSAPESDAAVCECKREEVCLDGECCKWGEILCDGECVNPLRDKDHCGRCDVECDRGPCKVGFCVKEP